MYRRIALSFCRISLILKEKKMPYCRLRKNSIDWVKYVDDGMEIR